MFDLLLVAHMGSALIGFGAIAVTGVQAWRARLGPGSQSADSVRRYFRPGVNWLGRVLFLVPVFGVSLVLASKHAFGFSDTFVLIGLGLWTTAAVVAELVVWPGERRIQQAVSSSWEEEAGGVKLRGTCLRVAASSAFLCAVFLVAVVIMVGQP